MDLKDVTGRDARRFRWKRMLPANDRARILCDPVMALCFALMDALPGRGPRPLLWEIAAEMCRRGRKLSAVTLGRRFKRRVGKGFREFVTAGLTRMTRARLRKPATLVKSVARSLGYDDCRAHRRLIVAHCHHPPAAWKRAA